MRIAIVDSGIDFTHRRLTGCKESGIAFELKDDSLRASTDYSDALGHGTACAGIIHKLQPHAELVAVKVFTDELFADERVLCMAIRWCLDNDIRIINLSLGITTEQPSDDLCSLCKRAFDLGLVVVAASHTLDATQECYPAFYPTVFGVAAGRAKKANAFGHIPNSPIEFVAKGTVHRVASVNGGFRLASGTSYACAYFTAIVSNNLQGSRLESVNELREALIRKADPHVTPIYLTNRLTMGTVFPMVTNGRKRNLLGRSLFTNRGATTWVKEPRYSQSARRRCSHFSPFPRLRLVKLQATTTIRVRYRLTTGASDLEI